ncbi:MAG TPA: hypothetical protein PLR88_08795, partial [Bacteroidales bacterium]|nr:hypothetical protein [Bacteroidales bacterium]
SDSIIEVTPERNFIPPMKDTLAIRNAPGNKPGSSKTSTKPSNNDQKAGDKSKDQSKTSVKTPEPVPEKGAYQLILFTGPKKDHYLTSSSRPKKYQLLYTLSLPPENMDFAFSIQNADEEAYFIEKSREKDTIKVWITDSTLYSQPSISSIVKYPFTDTLGINGYKQDTITMRFTPPRETRGAKVKKSVYEINTNIRGGSMKPGQQTILSSETPFRQLDTTHIRLYEVLDSTKIRVPYKLEKDSSDACRYFLNAKFLPKKKYFFIADSASINNIYNEYSDSLGINFVVKDPESYSKLILNVKNFKGNRIIQLLDTKEKLVKEVYMKADGKVEFPLLDNGFYRLRVIYDLNGDGKWTTGYFNSGQQPEPVSYFPTEIEIKTGFDIEQDWDIGTFNLKDYKLKALKKAK